MSEDEYPSLRKALFGNGHVGNLYCACKWATWHTSRVLLVLIFIGFTVIFTPLMLAWRLLVYVGTRVNGLMAGKSPEVNRTREPRFDGLRERVKTTPVARRVYNECPVDMGKDPKWFDGFEDRVWGLFEKLEPPDDVYVCNECGNVKDRRNKPGKCFTCRSKGTFEEVPETKVKEVHPDAETDP